MAGNRALARWIVGGLVHATAAVTALMPHRGELPAAELDARTETESAQPAAPLEGLASPELEIPDRAPSDALPSSGRKRVAALRAVLAVHVVESSGTSVAGALLALFRQGRVIDCGATDPSGVVRFDAREGTAEYALLAPGWAPARGVLELGVGERPLALDGRETASIEPHP